MKMDMDAWKQAALVSSARLSVPILTSLGFDLIERDIRAGVTEGAVQVAAIRALAGRYPFAASPMMMDLSVEAEAFGARIKFSDHEIPVVIAPAIAEDAPVEDLQVPSLRAGRVPEYLLAGRLAAQAITDRPVLAGCIGPFSLAGRLFGMTEIMTEMMMDPDKILLLLEKCSAFLESYVAGFKAAGVNGIIMAEPAAGMLSPDMCEDFSSAFIRRIVAKVQDQAFAVILHNCGNTGNQNRAMYSTGAWGLHFGNKNDIVRTLRELPGDVLVFGNIDPAGTIRLASPEVIGIEVTRLLEATAQFPNFVLSTGCDIPPGVSAANIDAYQAALDRYNSRS